MKEAKFYHCAKCGRVVAEIVAGKGIPACCGEEMEELFANTQDAATEKHVPVIARKDGKVIAKVGSASHPMTDAHFIQFIALVSEKGVQFVNLTPTDEPKAEFIDPEGPVAAYEFCNLHGLWKAEV